MIARRSFKCTISVIFISTWLKLVGVWIIRNFTADGNDLQIIQKRGIKRNDDERVLELILTSTLDLINLYATKIPIPNDDGSQNDHIHYNEIKAEFCELAWAKQKKDPTTTPMFSDLVYNSERCNESRIEIDLNKLIKEIRLRDQEEEANYREQRPSGFIFHESRCGSTAITNALAFASPKFRVLSEAAPTFTALNICGDNFEHCTREKAVQLFRDVVYIMGRNRNRQDAETETHLFFKFQSSMTTHIDLIQEAFPDVPWVFVYRDPVQVMVSNFSVRRNGHPQCAITRRHPPPRFVKYMEVEGESENVSKLSDEEYCAASMSYICQSAITALEHPQSKGYALSFDNLFDAFMDWVVPFHFNLRLSDTELTRMTQMKNLYSKARYSQQYWHDDSEEKVKKATDVIRSASDKYLASKFQRLQKIRSSKEDI